MVPFSFLVLYPFRKYFQTTTSRIFLLAGLVLLVLDAVFTGAGCCLLHITSDVDTIWRYSNLIFMLTLIPCAILYFSAIHTIWQQKLFLFSFTLTYALGMTSLNNIILYFLPFHWTDDGLPFSLPTLVSLPVLTMIFLPVLWLLLRNSYLPIMEHLQEKEHGMLAILSIILFCLLGAYLIPLDYSTIKNSLSLFAYFILLVSIFMVYFLCFRMLSYNYKNTQMLHQLDYAKNQLFIQNEQYKRIYKNIETGRKFRHNLQYHVRIIQGYLKEGNLSEAQKYLKKFDNRLNQKAIARFCDNPVVNMLVSFYYNLTEDTDVKFSCRIQTEAALPVDDLELAVLLGNLLENATEAALTSQQPAPRIYLTVTQSDNTLVFTLDNSYNGKVQEENGRFLSVKEHHTGLGLHSIMQIAEKYGGGTEFTYDDKEFHSSVILYFPEAQADQSSRSSLPTGSAASARK